MSDAPDTRPNVRTLIGVLILLAYLTAYALIVMALVANWMSDQAIWLQTIFYVLAGVAWLPPARWLLRWMAAPRAAGVAD